MDSLVEGHNIETNLLVNKALRRYLEWGRYAESFKLVTSDQRLMRTLWSYVPVDAAREMGIQNGNNTVVEFILYYFRKFDLESVLKTFRVIGAEYSNAYLYSEFGDDQKRTVILRHHMGRSASAFYGASFKALCNRLGLDLALEESEDQVVLQIHGVRAPKGLASGQVAEQLAKLSAKKTFEQ